ncbi:MAG: tRNA (guanosine(37)-N1)-methyltransferase TrmD [Bacillota bacterium]|jgi:tRNA (guanine37-N1)-methyltransferase
MRVFILTLFPEMFTSVLNASILKRACEDGHLEITMVNPRVFASDPHKTVDDYPYGGGPGMVLKPEPIYEAVEWVESSLGEKPYVVLLTPQGQRFTSTMAMDLAGRNNLTLVAGHYEGFDERIRKLADRQISIGDYVLTGGEIAAMVVLDAVARFVPGVLGDNRSAQDDSFSSGLLEGPQYTRPPEYRGMKVPQVLLEGDFAAIVRWRRKESLRRTFRLRRDLLDSACLTFEDRCLLEEVVQEESAQDDYRV